MSQHYVFSAVWLVLAIFAFSSGSDIHGAMGVICSTIWVATA